MHGRAAVGRRERPFHSQQRPKAGVNKSSTVLNLPGIAPASHHSSYLETIGGLGEPVEYDSKRTSFITREQSKLKGVLRRLNDDTLHLIDLIRPHKHAQSSPQQAHRVAEKQVDNRKKVIDHLQHDIRALEEQYTRLAQQQPHSELVAQQREIRAEIERISGENGQLRVEIQREGNHLTHGPNQGVAGLEVDLALAQQRLDRLRAED